MKRFDGLPGGETIHQGLEDLGTGTPSVPALIVSIGAPRLREAGLVIPQVIPDADHRLYRLLSEEFGDDAHSRYNSLLRLLVSFEQALECAP